MEVDGIASGIGAVAANVRRDRNPLCRYRELQGEAPGGHDARPVVAVPPLLRIVRVARNNRDSRASLLFERF